ncbi:MAG: hypothetical protein M1818_003128 [Claussenomyces sp. TS43310]|nr:MAG: hypothetical protein M1818_003128 [Claussenomyces sp. TS43310]
MAPISDLPDEILQLILHYVPPEDTLRNIQRVCRRLTRVSNEPLLWRYHCHVQFKYWDPKHRIGQKFKGSVVNVDWKKLYLYRQNVESQTTSALNGILDTQTSRIQKYEHINKFGYDAKDTLLRHCLADDAAEDVLARRYYSTSVLDHIHRAKALEEWWNLSQGFHVPLERALGAFDMFIIHDQHGDLVEISDLFDGLASKIRQDHPNVDELSPRHRALAIAHFLKEHDLTGINHHYQYRDLQNNYIGIALQDPEHPSLPLISVAIFCSLAQRFGLDAHCCGFPSHVHAVVYIPPSGYVHSTSNEPAEPSPIYLDPWRTDVEVPIEHLRTQLIAYGIRQADFSRFLGATSTAAILLRTSRNILATVHEFRGLDGGTDNTGHPTIRLHANPFADMDNAFYSALWANFLLHSPSFMRADPVDQIQFTPMILERFERLYPMDAALIERYVCPPTRSMAAIDHWELFETLRVVRVGDSMPKQVRLRDSVSSGDKVKHKIGQVFRHRRYAYTAIITGWDVECSMNSEWMQHNRIDTLDNGRHQSFYHAL